MKSAHRWFKFLAGAALVAGLGACGGRGGGGSNSSDPCDRLSAQCEVCGNSGAAQRCYQAVNLDLDSTCQQLLDSGTYARNGVECTN